MGVVRTDESRRAEIEEFRRMLLSCSGVVLKVTTEEEYNRRQVPAANRNEYTADQKLVCVTSGVSFLGIAIVKKLLLRGYSVRIIVDNEDDIERLREIEITEEVGGRSNITSSNQIGVVVAKFNERRTLMEAFDGCCAVFHTAAFIDPSGLSGYSKIMAEVEARAAENIAEACAATSSVRNYVLTSSLLTCFWRDISDSSLSPVVDHNTWSDESFCKRKKLWYALGKLKAEHVSWKIAKEKGLKLATICPGLITGPRYFCVNPSSTVAYLKGGQEMYDYGLLATVDVDRLADAHVNVYEEMNKNGGGEENVVQVVTDNAANYKAAGEMLMQKRKKLFWTPCAAHCIDLMLEDFEKKIEEHKVTITKGRKITSFIYNRSRLICLLKEFTKGKELLRPGATRFATSYLTLGRLFELKSALISFFASEKWLSTNYASTDTGKDVEDIVMDTAGFWSSVITCLRAAKPLMKVLRLVDSDSKPAMGFIYQAMVNAKKEIKANFKDIQTRYVPIYDIIDDRWYNQMNRAQHVAGYYLNPQMQYSDDFENNGWIKSGLYMCLERICGADENLAKTIDCQFDQFTNARGLFGLNVAKLTRKEKSPVDWWDSYGDDTPELKNFAMRILSLTCSSSGCERNWSAFEMVHSKRRNRLQQQKMNDLVYVMYNLKLNGRDENKGKGHDGLETLNLDDVSSDDEWITEEPSSIHDVNDDDDFLEKGYKRSIVCG